MPKITVICPICKKEFIKWPSSKKIYCTKKCYNTIIIGNNNPNFNHKWSQEKRNKQSELVKSKITDEVKYKSGSANRGKKFSQSRINKMHKHRSKESYSRTPTEKTKKIIGIKSKAKWTEEYKLQYRKKMEALGYWISLDNRTDIKDYYIKANWIDRMFDLIICNRQKKLLSECGVFNNRNNPNGVVRDHMLSRRTGFELGVFPEILRHPANCEILTLKDNIKKKRTKYIDGDTLTVNELFDKIIKYKNTWTEQELCLLLINRYNNGERYERSKIKSE